MDRCPITGLASAAELDLFRNYSNVTLVSYLMALSDLDLMMLEISVEQLEVPRVTEFDRAVMKKTVMMFRLLDKDWTSLYPQRADYQVYRGSNSDVEPFNGGVSVVFPIPMSSLEKPMENVELQIYVHRELSKYFERQSSESVGITRVDVSDLFNRVIEGVKRRNEDVARKRPAVHPREPVSRSTKDTHPLLNEDGTDSGAKVTAYLRLTHLGRSVISEIEVPEDAKRLFYAREETSEKLPYQCREISLDELTGGCWGSGTLVPPRDPRDTICCCDASDKSRLSKIQGADDKGKDSGVSGDGGDEGGGGGEKSGKSDKGGKGGKRRGQRGGGGTDGSNGSGTGISDLNGGDDANASCDVKPALCGREGTCNKKDKKGKVGKCGKPDGEGGNPLACGERRKCARRRSAAGSATVGIVDKKAPCPRPPPVCPCQPRPCPPPCLPCTPSVPCARCQPVYHGSAYVARPNACQNLYDTLLPYSAYVSSPRCPSVNVGWR